MKRQAEERVRHTVYLDSEYHEGYLDALVAVLDLPEFFSGDSKEEV